MIVAHPENIELLRRHIPQSHESPLLGGIRIVANSLLPIRRVERRWFPPANDRFVTYEPHDYGWLQKLGFGEYRDVDCGPLFYEIKAPDLTFTFNPWR